MCFLFFPLDAASVIVADTVGNEIVDAYLRWC